jgi:hypothetical protein
LSRIGEFSKQANRLNLELMEIGNPIMALRGIPANIARRV